MKPYPNKSFAFFIQQLFIYKNYIICMCGFYGVGLFLEKLAPYYFSRIIDVFSNKQISPFYQENTALYYLCVFIILHLFFYLFRGITMILFFKCEADLVANTKLNAMKYVSQHSACFLNNHFVGSLGAKITTLSNQISTLFSLTSLDIYRSLISLIFTFCILFFTNYLFGILFIMGTLLTMFIFLKSAKKIKDLFSKETKYNTLISGHIIDIIANHTLIKSFTSLKHEEKLLTPLLQNEKKAKLTACYYLEKTRNIQFITILIFLSTMLYLAIYLWVKAKISTGDIVLVLVLLLNISSTIREFIFALLNWHKELGEMDAILDILSTPHDIIDTKNAKKLHIQKPFIDFKNIFFQYNDKQQVLKDFNLKIKPFEKVGLVGVSGAGKSTLINLLQRFYEVKKGSILIDNQPINHITQDSLRENIALIPQETNLLNRSIYDNIAYANPKANKQQIITASQKAFAHDFITKLPDGYNTIVGDRGVKLSGGQRQRIAVARAILKNAPILILDEATSSLDSQSESYIQQSISQLMQGKTVIAIAHRLSTLQQMDRIIVLENGKIIEQGSPDSLLKNNGLYAKLWKIQTKQYIKK